MKALDKCKGRHLLYLVFAALLTCIAIAVYVTTDTEHYGIDKVLSENGLIPYEPEHLELMSPMENSSIKIFLLEQDYSYLSRSPPESAILPKLLVTVEQSSMGSQERYMYSLNRCSSYWIYAGSDGNAVEAVTSVSSSCAN